jgi:DNA-directed RNA polymerase subunit RPC12/RpoP
MSTSPYPTCPHCGQRVIKSSEKCLHCGKYVSNDASGGSTQSSSGINFTTILVIGLVVLGGSFLINVGMCGGAIIDVQQNGVDMSQGTATMCVSETADAQIADLQSQGWTEIAPKPGMRCFQD